MAFEEISSTAKYYRYEEIAPGTVLCEGWFVNAGLSKFKKSVYFVHSADGQVHALNGAGHLNHCFKVVTPEDYIRVTYVGKDKLSKGQYAGSDAHRFKLEIDKSRKGQRIASGFVEVAVEPVQEESADCLL